MDRPPSPCAVTNFPQFVDLASNVAPDLSPSPIPASSVNLCYNTPLGFSPVEPIPSHQPSSWDTGLKEWASVQRVHIPGRLQCQMDNGANITVTSCMELLRDFCYICPFTVDGWSTEAPTSQVTGFGYLPIVAEAGQEILFPSFYSPAAAETIISPDYFCSKSDVFSCFSLEGDIDTGMGALVFRSRLDTPDIRMPLTHEDGLWFLYSETLVPDTAEMPTVRRLQTTTPSKQLESELWHAHIGHGGGETDGIPPQMHGQPPQFSTSTPLSCLRSLS